MNEQESRQRAREDTAKHLLEHRRRQGKDPTYESVQREVSERADRIDKQRDRNIKE